MRQERCACRHSVRGLLAHPHVSEEAKVGESVEAAARRLPSHRRIRWDPDGRQGRACEVVPLLCAIATGEVAMVHALLECGADPVRAAPLLLRSRRYRLVGSHAWRLVAVHGRWVCPCARRSIVFH